MKFTRDLIIRFGHCDAAGIIFYPRFFGLVNETVEDWFASLGHSFKSLHVDRRKGVPTVRFECEFVGPVRIGDMLHVRFTVARKRPSKRRPDWGIVVIPTELVNQRGEVVQRGEHRLMIPRGPGAA